jgi:hypothetical protein
MKKLTFLMLFAMLGMMAEAQIARYLKVTATGTGTGLSWANAAGNADIQTMIDAVAADANKGTVYFAAGTYTPSASIIIKDGVNMTGGYSADGSTRDLSQYQTILDGAANKRILLASEKTLANGGANTFTKITTIDGLILQRGSSSYGSAAFITYGVVLQNCIIRNNNGSDYGAAVMVKRTLNLSSPTTGWNMGCALINCIIINNSSSSYAAGVWIDQDAHFSMINCIIANNKSTDATNGIGGLYVGGNIRFSRMTNNIFYNNTSAVTATNRNNFYSATTNFAAVYANYFSDTTIPVGFDATLTSASPSHGNKTSNDISTPDFVLPTSFQGYTAVAGNITEINNSNWRLKSTSGLINIGSNPTTRGDMPYPYSTMASFGSTNKLYSSITTDIMGSNRIISTYPEMGAYEYNPITITAATADAGMGSASGTTTVSKGSNVTLTATPTNGAYTFVNWTNGATVLSTNASYTFAATSTLTATANFLSFAAMTPTVTYARSANTIDVLVTNPTGYTGTITYNVLDGSDNVLATGVAKSAQTSTLVYTASGLTTSTSYTYKVVAVLDGSTNSQTATLNATTRKYKNGNIEVIDDFESGDLGWTGLSGGALTLSFANPTSSGINTSAYVAKVSITTGQQNYSGMNNTKEKIQVGPTAPYKYLHLKFKRTADNGGLNLTFLARNDISQVQMEPTLISYAATMIDGSWYDYVFDLSAVDVTDKTVFGFYIRPNKTSSTTTAASISYIDDIYLSNSETASTANITAQVSVSASAGGTATATATYISGDNVSLVATPSSDYHFVNWTENGSEVSTNASFPSFTAATNRNLVANFEPNAVAVSSGSTNASSIAYTTSDITVAAGAELVVDATKTLKSVTVAPGAKLTVNDGVSLTATNGITLQNTNSGTASFVDSRAADNPSAIAGTVEQAITETNRNWYVAVPVTGKLASDITLSGAKIVQRNEALSRWDDVLSGTGLTAGVGYIAVASATSGTTSWSLNGNLNSGKVEVGVTRSGASSIGFNLLGNPYPSYLNWEQVLNLNATNASLLQSSIWYRTKSGASYAFQTYNSAGRVATPTSTTGYIPPMQAFWVRANAAGTVTFTNAMRSHGDGASNKLKAPKVNTQKIIRLQLSNAVVTDEAVIYIDQNAQNAFDKYDTEKMFNNVASQPELYTKVGAEKLVINGLSEISDNQEILLGLTYSQGGDLKLKLTELNNFDSNTKVYLRDKQLSIETELTPETEYAFNTAAITNNESRFSLVYKVAGVSTGTATPSNNCASVFVNAANQITIIAPEKSNYAIYNAVGQLIENGINNSKLLTANSKLNTGVYVVKVNNQLTKVIIK